MIADLVTRDELARSCTNDRGCTSSLVRGDEGAIALGISRAPWVRIHSTDGVITSEFSGVIFGKMRRLEVVNGSQLYLSVSSPFSKGIQPAAREEYRRHFCSLDSRRKHFCHGRIY